MSGPKPRIYLLHGEDEQARQAALAKLRAGLGADDPAALDYIRLKGESLDLPALHDAALTVPFFAKRRLLHILQPLAAPLLKNPKERKAFLALLERVPPSTALVLEIATTLPPKHWLRRWADAHPDLAYQHRYALPENLTRWIMKQAAEAGGRFTPAGAAELARRVGNDAAAAQQEIHKLLAFVNYARPVEPEDVAELTPAPEHPNTFEMVDAIALGRRERALRLLHQLLQQEEPIRIWGMVIRQFRLLLLAREALDQGITAPPALAQRLKIHPFVAKKLLPQARRFRMESLETIYAALLETDRAWKTGQTDLPTALDVLVASLGR
jgi:DNA polymerase-3 subunit delta